MKSRLLLICATSAVMACSPEFESVDESQADIIVDGSSTVYPIMVQAARLYATANPETQVAVNFSGTTGGFRRFCDGEIQISAASREINAEEVAICVGNNVPYQRFDLGTDAIALVTHPRNEWLSSLTLDELEQMWAVASEGQINNWQSVNAAWPDAPLNLYGRGQDSGTYDYFTTQVTGEVRRSRMDYVASEDEEFLAAEIAADPNAFGFFGLGAYHRHWDTLRLVALDAGNGPVYPSLQSALDGSYQPLTRPLFLYVRSDALGVEGAEPTPATQFLSHLFSNIGSWMHFTGYLPLPEQTYQSHLQRLSE